MPRSIDPEEQRVVRRLLALAIGGGALVLLGAQYGSLETAICGATLIFSWWAAARRASWATWR